MINKLKNNIILYINIFIILLLFILLIKIQEFSVLNLHDLQMPFNFLKIKSAGRLPGDFIAYFINNFIPASLNIHPNDARKSVSAVLIAIPFILTSIALTNAFFLNDNKKIFLLKRFECIFILPFSFFILKLPICYIFYNVNYPYIFSIIDQHINYTEYLLGILPFFIFLSILFKLYFDNIKLSKIQKIFYSFIFFIVPFWNEFFLLSGIIILIFMYIFFQERTKNVFNNNLFLYISFIIGFCSFFIFSDYLSGNTIATYDYNFIVFLKKIPPNIYIFTKNFVILMILQKWYFYVLLFIFSFLAIKQDKANYKILIFIYIVIISSMITIYSTIFMIDIYYSIRFLFFNSHYSIIFSCILVYTILILLGIISDNKNKKIFFITFTIINILFSIFSIINYNSFIKYIKQIKVYSYNIEKIYIKSKLNDEMPKFPIEYARIPTTLFFPYMNFDDNEAKNYIGKVYDYESFYKCFLTDYYELNNEKGYMFIDCETEKGSNSICLETDEDDYILYGKYPFTNLKNIYIEGIKSDK